MSAMGTVQLRPSPPMALPSFHAKRANENIDTSSPTAIDSAVVVATRVNVQGFSTVAVFGRQVHVRVTGALMERAAFAAALAAGGLGAAGLEVGQATLEDVFLELVGRGRGVVADDAAAGAAGGAG